MAYEWRPRLTEAARKWFKNYYGRADQAVASAASAHRWSAVMMRRLTI